MDKVILRTEARTLTGKQVKQLRNRGITPIHLYGKAVDSQSLQIDTLTLQRVLGQVGRTSPVTLQVNGEEYFAFAREIQRHPTSGALLHVDFLYVPLTERMRGQVPLYLTGEAPAVRVEAGVLMQALHFLEVECLPTEMPSSVEVDISHLDDFEKAVHVSDTSLSPTVTILNNPEGLVVRVQPPRKVEEEAPVEVTIEEEAPAEAEEPEGAEVEAKGEEE